MVAFLVSIAARVVPRSRFATQWAIIGHWTLWLSALTAIVAATLGWQAYNSVNHDDAGHLAMTLHRNWALPTTLGLILLAAWDVWRHRDIKVMPWLTVVILLVISLSVLRTAWLGGERSEEHTSELQSLMRISYA